MVLVKSQGLGDPFGGVRELGGQVHDHEGVEGVDNNPTHTLGDHLTTFFGDGVKFIEAWDMLDTVYLNWERESVR